VVLEAGWRVERKMVSKKRTAGEVESWDALWCRLSSGRKKRNREGETQMR
jgi:hypothetical protein